MWDSARKCIDISEWFSKNENIQGWRKAKFWKREIKSSFRASSKAGSSGGANKESRVQNSVNQYLALCNELKKKTLALLETGISFKSLVAFGKHGELEYYYRMLVKHIDLVERRILKQEVIPSAEKLFSIFETHSEWLTKGKKFKPVEIGHNVLIATDQFHFIIHYKVLEKQTDSEITIELVKTLKEKFPTGINSLSLDKGFYSKQNKEFTKEVIPFPIMPKKGKRTKVETEEEHQCNFIKLRNAHSAVESNINQLQHNGLNHCPDKGIRNFKRYTALSVLAYNIHKLAEHINRKEAEAKAKAA